MYFSYAKSHADDISVGDKSSGSVGVQASPDKHEISTYTEIPEITIKDINASDNKIMFYTGYARQELLMGFNDIVNKLLMQHYNSSLLVIRLQVSAHA